MTRGPTPIVGCVLAGGLSRRMGGGDKALLTLGGKPMLAHVIDRLAPQVGPLIINGNGDAGRFAAFARPVVPDLNDDFAGPLAGVLAALRWAREQVPQAIHVVTAAADTPFFPADLVVRLRQAVMDDTTIAVAASGGKLHPVFALWPVALADDLAQWLENGQTRKILAWVDRHSKVAVEFEPVGVADPFFNANTPKDLEAADRLLVAAEVRA